ncbi:hypothetical protein FGB62_274g011 [Gracilaria domingensis]|nr:hypothetical protein FGB62_274g011 [Gracilaria domingensis]
MRDCEDYTSFVITTNPRSIPPALRSRCDVLDLRYRLSDIQWQRAISGAKATAGFPGGFPTASIQTRRSQYKHREVESPNWDQNVPVGNPRFNQYAAVDGGLINNEPFGILERLMNKGDTIVRGRRSEEREDEILQGSSALILVTPFPNAKDDNQATEEGMPMIQMFLTLLRILYRGLRYKEKDGDEEPIPRSLVTPFDGVPLIHPHDDDNDQIAQSPYEALEYIGRARRRELCCGGLGTFSGILDERLRLNDYQLGRANCQQFLKHTFKISPTSSDDDVDSRPEVVRQKTAGSCGAEGQADSDHPSVRQCSETCAGAREAFVGIF